MNYNQIIQKPGKEITPRVYYYSGEAEIDVSRDDFIQAKIFYNAPLVGTIMNGMELELQIQLPNTAIYLDITAKYGSDMATKTYGPYYLSERPTYNADKKSYTHKLYDDFVKTMVEYSPITITYPTTVLDFFIQLCAECNLTTDILSLPNGTQPINSDIYEGIGFTYRSVFDDIGQATGTAFKISGSVVQSANLGSTLISIDDDILKNQNIQFGQHYGPINSIVLSRGAESDNVFLRDEPSVLTNGVCEFKICDNQLMNENNRSDYLEAILAKLNGIEYDIIDNELVGYGGFEPFSKIQITTIDGDNTTHIFDSYVFNNEQVITQGFFESIYSDFQKESVTNYKIADTTDQKLKMTMLQVNKQAQTINATVQELENVENNLNNNYKNKDEIDASINDINGNIDNLRGRTASIEVNLDGVNINVTNNTSTLENMQYNFGTRALRIMSSEAEVNALFDNTGVKVYNFTALNAIFNNKGSGVDKLIVTGTAQIGYTKIVKSLRSGKKVTQLFHLNNLIEDLEDLL